MRDTKRKYLEADAGKCLKFSKLFAQQQPAVKSGAVSEGAGSEALSLTPGASATAATSISDFTMMVCLSSCLSHLPFTWTNYKN